MLIQLFLRYPWMAILMHMALGFLVKTAPVTGSFFYVLVTLAALIEIAVTRDRENLAAYYGIYLAGMEILYRMSKSTVFWEFGKYSCIAVLGLAGFAGAGRQQRPYLLLVYFSLLLPGILVSAAYGGVAEARIRDLTSQYLSGPAALLAAGWYYYQLPFRQKQLAHLLKIGVLPVIAVVTLLFLGKNIAEIDFIGNSNFDASGGFGPNQVSSALGWGIVLILLGMFLGASVTGYHLWDIALLLPLFFRGLLTLSRGGMMGAYGSVVLATLIMTVLSATFRQQMRRMTLKIVLSVALLVTVAIIANNLTGSFLLYRYQGKTTSEVLIGRSRDVKEYFSGREDILQGEIKVFTENPLLGIGIGRGTIYREANYQTQTIASHTEFSRMLGEHGIPGLIALFCAFILLPWRHFRILPNNLSRQWMLTLFILSMFTLAHSGMRMVLPAIAFGLAFIIIVPDKSTPDS